MFEPMPYLEWIEGKPAAATYDLGSSAVRPRPVPDENVVVPSPLAGLSQPASDGPSLREAIAAEYDVPTEQVLVTSGATQANVLAAVAAFGRATDGAGPVGDDDVDDNSDDGGGRLHDVTALVERPGYEPLVATPGELGAGVDRFVRSAEADYALDPDRVAAAASRETALITVSNRHNPSGHLSDREELAAFAAVTGDNDAVLLVDEVYAPYTAADEVGARDEDRTAFGGPTAAGLPNAVVTGSLTKFHGLEELRIGWLVGPAEVVERARVAATHLGSVAGPSRALARRFFAHRDDLVDDSRAHLTAAAERLREFVAGRDDLTASHDDPGCSFASVEHDAADGDAVAEAAWAAGILVVPGRFFGLPAGFRLSTGGDPSEVAEGLERLGAVLDGMG